MIAVIEGYRAGLYARHQWLPNIVAGLVVGIVALPLSMAFAIASGARPEQGIYTAIIGGGLVTLLGGSRLQIAGPTGRGGESPGCRRHDRRGRRRQIGA